MIFKILIGLLNIIISKFRYQYIYLCLCFRNYPKFLYLPILKVNKEDLEYIESEIKNISKNSYIRDIFLNYGITALAIIDNNYEYFSITLK
jgi:hypothetical protein